MTLRADQLRDLMALGIQGETLLEVVTIFERDASRDGRDGKAMAAERARKYRARQRENLGMAENVARETSPPASRETSRLERDGALILSSSASLDLGKEETEKKVRTVVVEGQKPSKRRSLAPLPDDWKPTAMHVAAANRLNLHPGIIESKAEDMRLWAQSNDIRKANWDATFHGFLRRAASPNGGGNGQRNGAGRGNSAAGPDQKPNAILAGVGRAFARGRGHEPANCERGFSGGGDSAAGLDPNRSAAAGNPNSRPTLELVVEGNAGERRPVGDENGRGGEQTAYDLGRRKAE